MKLLEHKNRTDLPIIDKEKLVKTEIEEDLSIYRKVFQFCEGCEDEKLHIISNDKVICIYCKNTYSL